MDLEQCLDRVELFQGLEPSEKSSLRGCCLEQTYRRNVQITAENEEAVHLWAVLEGQVDLRFQLPGQEPSQETTIASLTSGKAFGWSALVPPHRYRLSSYCVSDLCRVLQIDRAMLLSLFDHDPQIGYRVMTNVSNIIGTRFHQLQDEIILLVGDELLHKSDF